MNSLVRASAGRLAQAEGLGGIGYQKCSVVIQSTAENGTFHVPNMLYGGRSEFASLLRCVEKSCLSAQAVSQRVSDPLPTEIEYMYLQPTPHVTSTTDYSITPIATIPSDPRLVLLD